MNKRLILSILSLFLIIPLNSHTMATRTRKRKAKSLELPAGLSHTQKGLFYLKHKKPELAKQAFIEGAQEDSLEAQYNLSVLYEDEGDLEEAKAWVTIAAEGGYPIAQHKLAFFCEKENKLSEALYWYNRAAINYNILPVQLGVVRVLEKLKRILRN